MSFELWKGESDAQPYIPDMVEKMKKMVTPMSVMGHWLLMLRKTPIPRKSALYDLKIRRASLYDTTDLATLIWRMEDYHPASVIYLADKRQELHLSRYSAVQERPVSYRIRQNSSSSVLVP